MDRPSTNFGINTNIDSISKFFEFIEKINFDKKIYDYFHNSGLKFSSYYDDVHIEFPKQKFLSLRKALGEYNTISNTTITSLGGEIFENLSIKVREDCFSSGINLLPILDKSLLEIAGYSVFIKDNVILNFETLLATLNNEVNKHKIAIHTDLKKILGDIKDKYSNETEDLKSCIKIRYKKEEIIIEKLYSEIYLPEKFFEIIFENNVDTYSFMDIKFTKNESVYKFHFKGLECNILQDNEISDENAYYIDFTHKFYESLTFEEICALKEQMDGFFLEYKKIVDEKYVYGIKYI